MHGPGIVGEEHLAAGGQFDELRQGGFPGIVGDLQIAVNSSEQGGNLFAQRALVLGAKDCDGGIAGDGYLGRRFGETLRQPALGGSIGGAGADAYQRCYPRVTSPA